MRSTTSKKEASMRGKKSGRIITTTAPLLTLGALMILGQALDASAMSLFGGGSHGTPHQTVVPTNKNSNSNSNTGTNGSLSITANPVVVNPEPSTIVLLASGLLGLGLWRLRRKS